jgi:hypothetical protein
MQHPVCLTENPQVVFDIAVAAGIEQVRRRW